MNLVDVLKQQLGGEVSKTLGGMVGANEGDLSKVIGSALPGLLSGLGSLASTKEGAGKIADSIGGLDSGLFGNLAGMLGSSAASKGGSMLGSLFGGGLVDGIAGAISKFTGVNQGIVKMVLGYLTPMVLGGIGKNLGGGKPDAAGISRLFAEQKSNIASAIPSGFSLNSIQGFSSLANAASSAARTVQAPAAPSGGLGKLLIPAVILAALAGIYFYWNSTQQAAKNMVEDAKSMTDQAGKAAGDMVDQAGKAAGEMVGQAKDALGDLADLDKFKTDFTGMFDGLTGKLDKITDAAGAEAILPDLKGYADKLDGLGKSVTALPEAGKSMVKDLLRSQMDKINPILEKLTGIPNLGEQILKIIEQIKETLKSLVG